jgi:hypothetical protein
VKVWGAQLAGTVAIAFAIYLFFNFNSRGAAAPPDADSAWARYGLYGILVASAPALWYLRRFKRTLNAYVAVMRERGGMPDPNLGMELLRRLSIGGALCELPLALGVVYLLTGGEMRFFIGAAAVSVALRLSYRPFAR